MAFKDIINQTRAKEILTGQLRSGRIAHAYLFLGQEGVGRRKTALELAKTLNCYQNDGKKSLVEPCDHCVACQKIDHGNHPDVQTIDFAWQARLENKEIEKQKAIKIDTIRALQKDINLKPVEGRWKIYLIEPAEKITLDAANCLLKTLEEPPSWTVMILLAKHKENLPATIVSRTQMVTFCPLPEQDVASWVGTRFSLPFDTAANIARGSEGSLAAASLLAEDSETDVASLWERLHSRTLTADESLDLSQQHAKNAAELLADLLIEAKNDFRKAPGRNGRALESILHSQNLLEKNVNPQMVLDVLFLKLHQALS